MQSVPVSTELAAFPIMSADPELASPVKSNKIIERFLHKSSAEALRVIN